MSTKKTQDSPAGNIDIDSLDIAELRKLASTVYRIVVNRDMTAEDIRSAIRGKQKHTDYAQLSELVGNAPKPGYARILVHKDPTPGASNRPVPVAISGYRITVPRGVEVDVPIKVVGVLNDAKISTLVEDTSLPTGDPNRFKFQVAHSYPFSVVSMTPGPDPKPGFEASRAKAMAPRLKYHKKYGIWPKRDDLREAIRSGELNDVILD